MNPADALEILSRLKAAFPNMTLDEEQSEVLLESVALLTDPTILAEAVDYLIQKDERFPTIARIRLAYRSVADAHAAARAYAERSLPGPPASERGFPEWVYVYFWRLHQTDTARRAAQTEQPARVPVHQRRPVKMRDFPQFPHPAEDAYTMEEYERIRAAWVKAGSPKFDLTDEVASAAATPIVTEMEAS